MCEFFSAEKLESLIIELIMMIYFLGEYVFYLE